MKFKKLTRDQELRIRSIWLDHWNKKTVPSMEVAWFDVIVDYLNYVGYNLITPEVEELELIVSEKGLSEDYYGALAEYTKLPFEDMTEGEKFIHLLHASSEDRLKALKYALSI